MCDHLLPPGIKGLRISLVNVNKNFVFCQVIIRTLIICIFINVMQEIKEIKKQRELGRQDFSRAGIFIWTDFN